MCGCHFCWSCVAKDYFSLLTLDLGLADICHFLILINVKNYQKLGVSQWEMIQIILPQSWLIFTYRFRAYLQSKQLTDLLNTIDDRPIRSLPSMAYHLKSTQPRRQLSPFVRQSFDAQNLVYQNFPSFFLSRTVKMKSWVSIYWSPFIFLTLLWLQNVWLQNVLFHTSVPIEWFICI